MNEAPSIDFGALTKNSSGVYEIRLEELGLLRFTEIPFYSTVEVQGLPGSRDTYGIEIHATHGGGPSNEFFTLYIHVKFEVPGNADNDASVRECKRKYRVRSCLLPFKNQGIRLLENE